MKRAIPTLLLILLIQLALVAVVYWPRVITGDDVGPVEQAIDPGQVNELRIADEHGGEARLVKSGGRWHLPALHNLPADPDKVANLLDSLLSKDDSWPVARSAAARQRFQVADYLFQRHIRLLGDGKELRSVYLGNSPGFRKVHARIAPRGAIHAIRFNVFDAPASDDAWIDPRLLQVRTPMRIDADTYSVNREGGEWQSASGGVPDKRELLALLSALRSVQAEGVASEKQALRLATEEATLVLEINSLAGKQNLELYRLDSDHYIRSSEYPVFFRLSAYDFDRLSSIDFLLISGEGTD